MTQRKKPELLCPASSLEVLKCAVRYGADAVYIGGEAFGLRAKAKNFSPEEMAEGIAFAHAHGVRVHVTANILAHNYDLQGAKKYFEELRDLKYVQNGEETAAHPDALIVADPGMYSLCREVWPEAEIHISTQANNTNYETYKFWWRMGAKRVVSARELSLREIAEIRANIPDEMEIESFVHGAMCISYSGRCLLSNYFTGRDANHGACTHPCRWKYTAQIDAKAVSADQCDNQSKNQFENSCDNQSKNQFENSCEDKFLTEDGEIKYAIEEESRPGEYLPVYENERGTYIFNSRDLCMIEHIPELVEAGIDSWKIEGRMKTALYVATVARTYRRAIDDYFESPEKYQANLPWYRQQIAMCTYRKFSTGFFFGKPDENSQIYDNNTYSSDAVYLAMVDKVVGAEAIVSENKSEENQAGKILAGFEQRNKFAVGDEIEIMKPDGRDIKVKVLEMYHVCVGDNYEADVAERLEIDGKTCMPAESCPHAKEGVWVRLSENPEPGDLLRAPAQVGE